MNYKNNIHSEYKINKEKLRNEFPQAFNFLENIENRIAQDFHIGTTIGLHLYFKNHFLFYLVFLPNNTIQLKSKQNGILKKGTENQSVRFFQILTEKSIEFEFNFVEFQKRTNCYYVNISNTEKAKVIFDIIYKTLDILESKFISNNILLKSYSDVLLEEEKEFIKAQKMSVHKRRKLLEKTNPKPTTILVQQTVFNRNQIVVADVLNRANGVCERCKQSAPFFKDNSNTPYLEVHHKIPLSEGGDDTVENAIALCPNCHRHAHYGKLTY